MENLHTRFFPIQENKIEMRKIKIRTCVKNCLNRFIFEIENDAELSEGGAR